jgi:hypothetical protein
MSCMGRSSESVTLDVEKIKNTEGSNHPLDNR